MGKIYSPIANAVNAPFIFHSASRHLASLVFGEIDGVVDARLEARRRFPGLFREKGKVVASLDIASIYPVVKSVGVMLNCNGESLDEVALWDIRNRRFTDKTWLDYIAAPDRKSWNFLKERLEEGFRKLGKEF